MRRIESSTKQLQQTSTPTRIRGGLVTRRRALRGFDNRESDCDACGRSPMAQKSILASRQRARDRHESQSFIASLSAAQMNHNFSRINIFAESESGRLAKTVTPTKHSQFISNPSHRLYNDKRWTGESQANSGMQLNASLNIQRPQQVQHSAYISDQGEAGSFDDEYEGIVKLGRTEAEIGEGAAAPLRSGGGCSYGITYANLHTPGCGTGRCGARIVYDVTGVTASGSGCPATLNGLRLTESVTTDNGCGPGSVRTGAGCPITATAANPRQGTIANCTDTYGLCGPAASFPAAGCTEIYTQNLYVGGRLAETRRITWRITRSGSSCSGSVTRT